LSTDPTEPSPELPGTPEVGTLVPIAPTRIGRDACARFAPDNAGGTGAIAHERTERAREFRQALHAAVSPKDIAAVGRALVEQATIGDVRAARELLDRIIGRTMLAQAADQIPAASLPMAEVRPSVRRINDATAPKNRLLGAVAIV
jgi:hypothetical protein